MLLLFTFENHADVIGRARLEIDGGDADELPAVITEPVQLLGPPRIHRVILRPDIDDLVLPGLHGSAPSRGAERCTESVAGLDAGVVGRVSGVGAGTGSLRLTTPRFDMVATAS